MSTLVPPPPSLALPSRALGTKFFVIVLLALFMSMTGFLVESLTTDRADSHGVLAASAENPTVQPQDILGIRLADSYRSTRRSLHYITLFLGLVFLTYFLFEIFYLLLLSLAEHLGFDLSFLIAGASTVTLFSLNTDWLFHSRKLALRALAVFSLLYTFIYVLLRVEAYALLVGAIASFVAVAAAMYITRNVDWYGSGTPSPNAATSASGPDNY